MELLTAGESFNFMENFKFSISYDGTKENLLKNGNLILHFHEISFKGRRRKQKNFCSAKGDTKYLCIERHFLSFLTLFKVFLFVSSAFEFHADFNMRYDHMDPFYVNLRP